MRRTETVLKRNSSTELIQFNKSLNTLSPNIFVSDSGNSRVQIFDEHGNYMDTFGEKGSLDSQLKDPSDLIIESDGNIIIVDSDNGVVKVFSSTKQILQKIGENEIFKYAYSCVKYKQYLIVSDYHEDCVKVFDREQGTFLYKFGRVGNGDGQFKHPSCVAVDKAGHLMVCDENNHRIQVLKLNGEFVAKFGSQGSELGELNLPCSIAVLSDGRIVFSDYMRIIEFKSSSEYDIREKTTR